MTTSKLTDKIRAANQAGRKALIPFLPAGFPDKARFWEELKRLDEQGADIIEIGVPFSDPVADGPVVEQASLDCLTLGVCLSWLLGELGARRASIKAELVLMGYVNPFLQYGLENLARDAAEAGVAGLIVPDLPLEEFGLFLPALTKYGVELIPLVGLNTPNERLEIYAKHPSGFVYFVSVLGATGVRDSLPEEIKAKLVETRKIIKQPIAIGFGIKTPEQLAKFGEAQQAFDAVVFGSALIAHIRQGSDAADFMRRWK